MFLRVMGIALVAALLGGCPDVLLKVVDDVDDEYIDDDDALTIREIDDIYRGEDMEVTVEVVIDDRTRDDRTTDVTLKIKCDDEYVTITPSRRRASNSIARWRDIDLEDFRGDEHFDDDDDYEITCTVTAEAWVDNDKYRTTETFDIRGSSITAIMAGSRISFDNTDDENFVTLVRRENSSRDCRAGLVVWPSNKDDPIFIIDGENDGIAAAKLTRGKLDGLHLTGDASRCRLKVGKTLVEIPDEYEYRNDIITSVSIYRSDRIRVYHRDDVSRTIDIAVYDGSNKVASASRTMGSGSYTTFTITDADFERRVDYTVWIRYYNRVIMFTDVDGSW